MKRTSLKPTQRKSRRSKGKGRALQQWVAGKISDLLGIPHGQDELIESRRMGQSGVDVVLRGHALERFPFVIECASGQTIGWLDKMRQVKRHLPAIRKRHKFIGTKQWLLFLKRKEFQTPVVMLDADLFFVLMQCALDSNTEYDPAWEAERD